RAQETAVARASCPCRTLPWQFQEVVFLDSRLRGNDRFVSGHFPALQQRPPRVVLRRELPGSLLRAARAVLPASCALYTHPG
ncbi:MAG TPA: hypothetical protein PLG27_10135, partial [Candidatus Latescibacteria bacterium]|nr:hypothetical protein [Candidatus Latescibacterota bacterium]